MCSNKCANPVHPGRSFLEPTPYQRLTPTTAVEGSGESTTRSPLSREWRSHGTCRDGDGDGKLRPGHHAVPECGRSELLGQPRGGLFRPFVETAFDLVHESPIRTLRPLASAL